MDLIRAIRNIQSHFNNRRTKYRAAFPVFTTFLSEKPERKDCLGIESISNTFQEDPNFVVYFTSIFPKLLIHTYIAGQELKNITKFEKYYNRNRRDVFLWK